MSSKASKLQPLAAWPPTSADRSNYSKAIHIRAHGSGPPSWYLGLTLPSAEPKHTTTLHQFLSVQHQNAGDYNYRTFG